MAHNRNSEETTMSHHRQRKIRDPFTKRKVGIDEDLVPIIKRLWALGIETTSSCQGPPVYDRAVICFAEPKWFYQSPNCWSPKGDDPNDVALYDHVSATWEASRPDGARQVVGILVKGPWAHMTARWYWTFGDDPDTGNEGSALLLPTTDLPLLAKALGTR
jgi:hypothetical protein